MSTMAKFLQNSLVDFIFRGFAFTPPTDLYFALTTTLPTATTAGTEVSAGGYSRAHVVPGASTFTNTQNSGTGPSTGTGGLTENVNSLAFGTASADWGTVVACDVYDAPVGGNRLGWAVLSPSRNITNGTTVSIPGTDLQMTFS